MSKKKEWLSTKRLYLKPLSAAELAELARANGDTESATDFSSRARAVSEHTASFKWYTYWKLCLKDDGTGIGFVGFSGEPDTGKPAELNYFVSGYYSGKGYANEAVRAICSWCFREGSCFIIRSASFSGDTQTRDDLLQSGFNPIAESDTAILWQKEKPATDWFIFYLFAGIALGGIIGLFLDVDIALSIGYSAIFGFLFGYILDVIEKNKHLRCARAVAAEDTRRQDAVSVADDGATALPSDAGASALPADDGATTYPTDKGVGAYPAEDSTALPVQNGTATYPEDDNGTTFHPDDIII